MTSNLPSLAGAEWLAAPGVRRVFAALNRDGDEARIVGGAVRDALAGRLVGDIDFATTAVPEVVAARARDAGLKVAPTGIEHGTLTLVADGVGYQVTTLREDVETDGRRAVVRFGRDWAADARRRDFTVNALLVDAAGTVHDPLGGYPDVAARRVRFIGDADQRIAEDRLRILRFFRFNAEFGDGEYDPAGLAASIRARNGIGALSGERIGQEMRRLVLAPRSVDALALMQDAGILPVIFAGVGYLGPLARVIDFEMAVAATPSVALRLAALGCRVEEDADRIGERLKLTNAERNLMRAAVAAARRTPAPGDGRAARRFLYDLTEEAYRAAAALAFAWSGGRADIAAYVDLYRLPERWPRPRFPLGGRDALGAGASHGPAVGAMLKSLEAWWIAEDFAPSEDVLRGRLQQMIAAAQ
ncbi:MAG TPA: CCA tRNA nucleotidyltransferase [Bauldia sp.]|nr:CCA tRNA nucleotidyltransferase [Bauldia sp.]